MTTQRCSSAVRAVLLASLLLALCGAVSHGGVIESHRPSPRVISRESSVSETLRHLVRHSRHIIPDLTLFKRTYAAKANNTMSSGESRETDVSKAATTTATAAADAATTTAAAAAATADAAKNNDANSQEDDEDKVYDDAFGGDSSLVSPLDENGSDADILSNNNNLSSSNSDSDNSKTPANVNIPASETSNQGASTLKDASAGNHVSVQAAHSTWQVTLMTVIMCSLGGMVLLLVVGAWYKDLGFRSFRPGKPEHMLLEDDEHSVYHRTTQPEPRQVGTYAPLT